jgi:D-alanyl-D-alanine carboxypeptidase (penicillin-binding protein 5/6)
MPNFSVVRLLGFMFALMAFAMPSLVQVKAAEFESKAEFAILIDAETGAVLYQKNADQLMAPASMSKLMTIAIVFKALKTGQISPEDDFYVSENAWRKGGGVSGTSSMFAPLNKRVKLSDLLQGIIVQSGNDAAIILAEGLAGSEDAFARMMTDYAREIGLDKSTFGNSTGLPDPEQLMTARELALLALHIKTEFPEYYRYFSQRKYFYKKYRFYNRNPLIHLPIGIDGLKTGFTKDSGYGIVGSGVEKGRRLVFVVNGLKTKKARKQEARRLYEWGLRGFKAFRLFMPDETVSDALVWGGEDLYVPLVGKNGVRVLMPRAVSSKTRFKASIVYNKPLKAPIRRGDKVAILRVHSGKTTVSEVPLYAGKDIQRGGFIRRGWTSLVYLALGWIL